VDGRQAIGPADTVEIAGFQLRLEPTAGPAPAPEPPPPAPAPPRAPQALVCPQCAAPLHVFPDSGPLVTCIYCNTVVRL